MPIKKTVLVIAWSVTLLFIPILSYFGRDLLASVLQHASRFEIAVAFAVATLGLIGCYWYWLGKIGEKSRSVRVAFGAFGAGLILFLIPPGERWLHVPLFGFFGFLSTRLLGRAGGPIVALSVGAIDELWQHFLPARNGDPVDVAINGASATLGIVLAYTNTIRQRLAPNGSSGKPPMPREH